MKYSSAEVDVYEVESPVNHLPDLMYDDMTESANETIELVCENSNEEKSLVSNLPLLFADGYPISLEKMTLTQLENFVTFMIECSSGNDINEVIDKPTWWPEEIKFSNPLIRPKMLTHNWMASLKKIVLRCYVYHKSEYLLRFCTYLARYSHEELNYVNNWDSTTSLYHKNTSKLLVTFRNENMVCIFLLFPIILIILFIHYYYYYYFFLFRIMTKKNENPRRTLLFHNGITSNFANKSKQQTQSFMMVQPPSDDIYLCDNCDAEFVGLEKMKEHEMICCEQQYHESNSSRPSTPDFSTIQPETNQNEFLEYFHLRSREKEGEVAVLNKSEAINNTCIATKTSSRLRGLINLTKSRAIPFSSPAGIVLAKKSKKMTEETQQERLERIERHVLAPPITSLCRPKWLDKENERDRWVTTYRFNRDKQIDYVHQYKFSDALKGKPVLDIRSQILYAACRPVFVTLTKLNPNSLKHRNSSTRRSYKKVGPASKTKLKILEEVPVEKMITEESMSISQKNTSFVTSVTNHSENKSVTKDSTNEITEITYSVKQKSIIVIDLCSSDEEEIKKTHKSDENQDPMNSVLLENSLSNLSTNKICSKARIYPANSTNHWLMQSIFNEDNENHVNRCHIGDALTP
ncbi:hypothetical protein M0802_010222 [Mischocyttarus mexicanus]|nr:hypothetical protein M0802_010222 [Mischocyttarus mexicanus]